MLTESDVWKSNEIMSANYEAELDMNTLMKLVRAIEAEVRAEVQEPVEFPTPPNGTMAHPILGDLYDRLQMQQYAMKYAMLLAAPQPPVPCPQCASFNMAYRMKCDEETKLLHSKVAERGLEIQRLASVICDHVTARGEMQAKVAEQTAEIERLTNERDAAWSVNPSVSENLLLCTIAQQVALIEQCENALLLAEEINPYGSIDNAYARDVAKEVLKQFKKGERNDR